MQILNERRVRELDILKGIGIMLIVLGHLEPGTYLMRFIYSFHLFIFFACSGFVGARYKNREIVGIIKENIKRLLLPYLLWCAISQIIALIYDNIDFVTAVENILYINANVGWNAALWFLVSLFWTDSIGAVITKLNKWAYILFLVLSIGVWIIIAQSQVVLPFGLYTVPAGLTFWILGYWVSANKIHQKLKMLSTACKLAGGGVLLVLV